VRPDHGGSGGGFEVRVDSVSGAAAMLVKTGQELAGDVARVRDRAVDAVAAIPPSDLQEAFAYCWGRWSQALEDASVALAGAGPRTHQSAGGYEETERGNAGGFRAF
jgi:uncharacterized protein YukE